MDGDAILQRALRAYFRIDPNVLLPSESNCEMRQKNGRWYAIIRNSSETLMVYRVQGNPIGNYRLVGLKEWPEDLEVF